MPAQPPAGPAGPAQDDPHPWQNQMRAARDRNEQTQVQPFDPAEDPLRHAPQRGPRPPQRPRQQEQNPRRQQGQGRQQDGYGHPDQGYGQQRGGYRQPPPQHYQEPYPREYRQPPPQYHQPEPQPRRPEPRPQRERRPRPEPEPREPRRSSRSANPMRIPGLGCLKGCLFMVLILVVIGALLWNLTPLPEWVAQGQGFWEATTEFFDRIGEWTGLIDSAQERVEGVQGDFTTPNGN
ncbi:hypothetical protein HCJ92_13335 [Streptomyces sp. ventii]|uniref:Serine/threonine protein kinase n=1 Tax=Streptomyces spiramenti TaxID=2720606 RepID=A0ABX1ALY6_9ACTN|nr:hypothetical protein [Streptomyces spiramenti]